MLHAQVNMISKIANYLLLHAVNAILMDRMLIVSIGLVILNSELLRNIVVAFYHKGFKNYLGFIPYLKILQINLNYYDVANDNLERYVDKFDFGLGLIQDPYIIDGTNG